MAWAVAERRTTATTRRVPPQRGQVSAARLALGVAWLHLADAEPGARWRSPATVRQRIKDQTRGSGVPIGPPGHESTLGSVAAAEPVRGDEFTRSLHSHLGGTCRAAVARAQTETWRGME